MQAAKPRIPLWLIIVYSLSVLTILAWPFLALMSAFAFDDPASLKNMDAILTVIGVILAYPLLPVIGVPASFFAYRASHKRAGYVLAAIAAIPLALFILLLIVGLLVNTLVLLGVKV